MAQINTLLKLKVDKVGCLSGLWRCVSAVPAPQAGVVRMGKGKSYKNNVISHVTTA